MFFFSGRIGPEFPFLMGTHIGRTKIDNHVLVLNRPIIP